MSKDHLSLLYPRTRFEVLRTLYYAGAPVPLRAIAYRSGILLGSVQSAIQSLERSKIVVRTVVKGRPVYRIRKDKGFGAIENLIQALKPLRIQQQAKRVSKRAKGLLAQLEERNRIIAHGRESLRS